MIKNSVSFVFMDTKSTERHEAEDHFVGEADSIVFQLSFNHSIKIRSRDDRLTSNAGALLLREADHRLGLVESLAATMVDPRDPDHSRYSLVELLRERLYALALNYRAADDVDFLAHDPAMRLAVWDRRGEAVSEERLASQPTQSRLVDLIAHRKGNLEALRTSLGEWVERHLRASGKDHAVQRGTLDVDGLAIPTHGAQEGRAYNGYYGETIYYPLVAGFAPEGDYDSHRLGEGFVHAILRKGNDWAAGGALRFILSAYRKCASWARSLDVRMDAGFAIGHVMDGLTDEGIRFVARLKTNPVVERMAAPYIYRPVGRPPKEGYEYCVELGEYQAESWRYGYRVVLVVVDAPHPTTGQLALFPHAFFLITTWRQDEKPARELLQHYRGRGTFEDRLGEFRQTVASHLSSPLFHENEALLLLALQAFNLGSMLRGEIESESQHGGWDLGRLQSGVLKAGGRLIQTGRRLILDVAQAVLPVWTLLCKRLQRWRLPSRWTPPKGAILRPWIPPPPHAHLHVVLRI